MNSSTITRSEPTPNLSDRDRDPDGEAQHALEWLARATRWERRLDQLRGDTA